MGMSHQTIEKTVKNEQYLRASFNRDNKYSNLVMSRKVKLTYRIHVPVI